MYTSRDYEGRHSHNKMVISRKTSYWLLGLFAAALLYGGYQWSKGSRTALFAMVEGLHLTWTDLLTYVLIIGLITVIYWLSSREIKKSLEQTRQSEASLSKDKDYLEHQVKERIEELQESRLLRMDELAKAAEFGRLSQGLFHDLMTPLTSIILNTEKLRDVELMEVKSAEKNIEKALQASDRMVDYIKEIRSTLKQEETDRIVSFQEELKSALHLFSHKIRSNGIEIVMERNDLVDWYGNPLKIRQIFSNLVSNAIDSFEGMKIDKKNIKISLINEKNIIIKIEDNGSGIDKDNLDKIFNQFFTTKPGSMGTGIGLTTVQMIVEKTLKGKIEVESKKGLGTCFTISFKINNQSASKFK